MSEEKKCACVSEAAMKKAEEVIQANINKVQAALDQTKKTMVELEMKLQQLVGQAQLFNALESKKYDALIEAEKQAAEKKPKIELVKAEDDKKEAEALKEEAPKEEAPKEAAPVEEAPKDPEPEKA